MKIQHYYLFGISPTMLQDCLEKLLNEFELNFTDYKILMDKLTDEEKYNEIFYSFETPYYKIRVGKYVSRILASKELKKIKKDFSSAFILQPK